MSKSSEQKIRLLVLYDILKSESDEERPLSTNELIEKLNEYGITATRQTIYDDIEMLNAFGYEILCDHGRNNRYFVGDRAFELPEVQILLHAVGASKSLSAKKSAVLTDKIAELLGNVQADKVKDLLTENECEYDNEAIYYSIDTITTALIEKHKLSFLYFDIGSKGERIYRKGKERYEVNPLGMVYSGECFYLVCFHDKYGNPASYRIDKMDEVRVEDEPITKKKEYDKFDLKAYKRETFGMYYGEKTDVTLSFPKELFDIVVERFGDIPISSRGTDYLIKPTVRVSKTFFAWLTTFEGKIRIIAPQEVAGQYKDFVLRLYDNL